MTKQDLLLAQLLQATLNFGRCLSRIYASDRIERDEIIEKELTEAVDTLESATATLKEIAHERQENR